MPWFHDLKYEGAGRDSRLGAAAVPDGAERCTALDIRLVQLRLGNVLLEWADALFRADDPSSTARARELYKAVLWLHGDDPAISPDWPNPGAPLLPILLRPRTESGRRLADASRASRVHEDRAGAQLLRRDRVDGARAALPHAQGCGGPVRCIGKGGRARLPHRDPESRGVEHRATAYVQLDGEGAGAARHRERSGEGRGLQRRGCAAAGDRDQGADCSEAH